MLHMLDIFIIYAYIYNYTLYLHVILKLYILFLKCVVTQGEKYMLYVLFCNLLFSFNNLLLRHS